MPGKVVQVLSRHQLCTGRDGLGSNSLTNSFDAQKFGKWTTPGQIFINGVVKFQ
jgi:hypothetical protein